MAGPEDQSATAWLRWGALLWISLAGSAGCSPDHGRVSVRVTPGREVVLLGGGASFDTRASFVDGELIFWQHEVRTGRVLAAFLDKPFGVRHEPRLIKPSDDPHAFTAAADAAGR